MVSLPTSLGSKTIPVITGAQYEVWSPYDAAGAAEKLMAMLRADAPRPPARTAIRPQRRMRTEQPCLDGARACTAAASVLR